MSPLNPQHARLTFMIVHFAFTIGLFTFLVMRIVDMLSMMVSGVAVLFTILYAVPVAIMIMCGRNSKYETGWVEVMYQSLQTGLTTVALGWVIAIKDPVVCPRVLAGEASREASLDLHQTQEGVYVDTYDVCKGLPIAIALASLSLLALLLWFGWTLWLATKAARMMLGGWTRSSVLRRMTISDACKVCRERTEQESIDLGKLSGVA